ncbi:MAG: ADP-ribose pyrophosphatase [Patescibacteria group bacterium]|nr:MAG: ADP-ribose pyrophosphatase [Patescibacteria group bacterium]
MQPKKWKLLSKKDVSPSKWFPIEERTYQLPNGRIVDDFTVTTLADVAMIVPITKDKKVIIVNQYKPGVDEVIMQFPAGRIEDTHKNMDETAQHELEEETGVKVELSQLTQFARLSGFSTKATEIVFVYLAKDCEFNSQQHFDSTEDIEIVKLSFEEMDRLIEANEIWCGQTIAAWELAKKKFPAVLR